MAPSPEPHLLEKDTSLEGYILYLLHYKVKVGKRQIFIFINLCSVVFEQLVSHNLNNCP